MDHVGPSLPLELWKVLSLLKLDKQPTFLNKIWSTVPEVMEIWAATEDGWTVPSATSRITELPLKETIHTPLEMESARLPKGIRRFQVLLMSRDATFSQMPLIVNPLLWLLMPQFGPATEAVSWATVELLSTTVSWLLESPEITGESRILGAALGENQDSSDSPSETHVLSAGTHHTPHSDPSTQLHQSKYITVNCQ